jgi:UDP-N-acetylmuramyl pentapeptide phosphotransferase/UDP-N-acetylglucosamine-1-phosphate transferase
MIPYILIAFLSAMIAVTWIHPKLVKIASMKNIVDCPDARKLQRTPIPVLGGVAVFFGIVLGIALTSSYMDCKQIMTIVAAMMIMLYVGTMDDIMNLSAKLRFLVETGVVVMLIFSNNTFIDNFNGLWGWYLIPKTAAIPFTIFAAVGIINSINLIDGVNGLSSGYCIMASAVFGILFYMADNVPMTILATVSIGSLIPFFLHNVFGKKSKMFIGDGGTLVMGVVMSTFVVNTLSIDFTLPLYNYNFGLAPFALAVMSIPVFDTLRVMISRILRGTSPFHPDKTHLHHLFIELGFSHAGTTISILTLNSIIIVAQLLCWKMGASIDIQLYVVIALSILFTIGLYNVGHRLGKNSFTKKTIIAIGRLTHLERKGIFLFLQRIVDKI